MGAHRYGLPLAVVAAIVAVGAATALLRPRGGAIEPVPVEAEAYFSPAQLDRARDFREPQRLLGLGGLALEGALLVLVAWRPPRRIRGLLERAARKPIRGAALTGAGLSLALAVVVVPTAAFAHDRAVDVGLSTQNWGAWVADLGKAAVLGALFAAGGAAAAVGLGRRFPRAWWAPASACVVGVAAAFTFLSPVLLEPLFNRFTPLPDDRLRADVIELARKADVRVGEVYRVDASRRTTGTNAYVGGLGRTKRVVLYDNLIEKVPPDQVRSVVAHELAHVKHRDVPRGLLWLAIVAPPATLLVQRLSERLLRRRRGGLGAPVAVPALALSLALVSVLATVPANVLSRRVEAQADAFALDLTRDPAAFIGLQRRLVADNVAEPRPPAWHRVLFGSHPDALDRIGASLSWARRN